MKFKLLFILLLLCLVKCEKIQTEIPLEEYGIYNAFFKSISEKKEIEIDSVNIAIIDSTSIVDYLSLDDNRVSILEQNWDIELPLDLINDYQKKNASNFFIQDYFKTDFNYQMITTDKLNAIFSDSFGWLNFEEKYPEVNSTLRFSRVGLNNQKNKALIYVGISCGPLCGTKWFYLFERIDGRWELTKEYLLAIS